MNQNRREFLKGTLLASAGLVLPGAATAASLPVESDSEVEFDWDPETGQADLRYETTKHDLELDTGNPLDQAAQIFNWLVYEQKLHLYPAMTVFGLTPDVYHPVPGPRGFLSHHSDVVVCSMKRPGRAIRDLSLAAMYMASELVDVCRYGTVKGFTIPYVEAVDRHSGELLDRGWLQVDDEVEMLLSEPHVCLCLTTHAYVPEIAEVPAEEHMLLHLEDAIADLSADVLQWSLQQSYKYHGGLFN